MSVVTVLVPTDGRARKRVHADGTVDSYHAGRLFRHGAVTVQSLAELETLLVRLSNANAFIIHGYVRDDAPSVIRRKYLGEGSHVLPQASRVLCLDIDGIDVGTSVEEDPEGAAKDVRASLPVPLDSAPCLVQFSTRSSGTRAYAHVWYYLDHPCSDTAAKAFAKKVGADTSLYNPVQPHFVASPEFVGCEDPLPRRLVRLDGGGAASLQPRASDDQRRARAVRHLMAAEREIRAIRHGEARHPIVNRHAFRLGQYVGCGALSAEEVSTRLYKAATSGPHAMPGHRAADEIRRAVDDGIGQPHPETDWRESLLRSKDGGTRATPGNVTTILLNDPTWSSVLAFDDFANKPFFLAAPDLPEDFRDVSPGEAITDEHIVPILTWLEREYQITMATSTLHECVVAACREQSIHPVREWLEALSWDGQERLGAWLPTYAGTADDEYHRTIGRAWLLSMVARVMVPGCQADYTLVLEGPQGVKKTQLLTTLAGPWRGSLDRDLRDKDAAMGLQGAWLVEIDELDAIRPGRNEAAVKSFLTRRVDRFRPPYGRTVKDFPRQCVFAGSTNQEGYIHDPTGGRRFWPVRVGWIDVDALLDDREQIFAEAFFAFLSDEQWWLDDETLARSQQAERTVGDPWLSPVLDFLGDTPSGAYAEDILTDALAIPMAQQTPRHVQRVRELLNATPGIQRDHTTGRGWRYKKPPTT